MTGAVVLLCWDRRVSMPAALTAGAAIGYATVVRTVGLPLLVVAVCLLARRVGWRPLAALIRWRRLGGFVLLPWSVAVVLLVLPMATSGFSYRYTLAVIPPASIAAGLAFARRDGSRERDRRGRRSGDGAAEGSRAAPKAAITAVARQSNSVHGRCPTQSSVSHSTGNLVALGT